MTSRVFITGGAGFLGINCARHLLARGYDVTTFDVADFDYPERDRVTVVRGDIRDRDALAAAMQGARFVVHAAAALPLYPPDDIYTIDVVGTRNVLEIARETGVERAVHVSSTAVYGIPDHHPLLEDDRLDGVGPYGSAKVLAEYECLRARSKGLCVPIVRPKSFVGPERLGVFALLYQWAWEGRSFPLVGDGRNRYQLLDVEDLCEAIRRCLELPRERVDDTFNIGAAVYTTMREDFQAVLDEAGHGGRIIGTPAAPVILTLRLLERLGVSPLYKWVYETAATDSFVSIDRARAALDFEPRYSNRDALVRNYRWYVANRERFTGASGISHRVPWREGALGLIKRFF